MGLMDIFGYPYIKKKARTSSFFNVIYQVVRLAAILVVIGVVLLLVGLALNKH